MKTVIIKIALALLLFISVRVFSLFHDFRFVNSIDGQTVMVLPVGETGYVHVLKRGMEYQTESVRLEMGAASFWRHVGGVLHHLSFLSVLQTEFWFRSPRPSSFFDGRVDSLKENGSFLRGGIGAFVFCVREGESCVLYKEASSPVLMPSLPERGEILGLRAFGFQPMRCDPADRSCSISSDLPYLSELIDESGSVEPVQRKNRLSRYRWVDRDRLFVPDEEVVSPGAIFQFLMYEMYFNFRVPNDKFLSFVGNRKVQYRARYDVLDGFFRVCRVLGSAFTAHGEATAAMVHVKSFPAFAMADDAVGCADRLKVQGPVVESIRAQLEFYKNKHCIPKGAKLLLGPRSCHLINRRFSLMNSVNYASLFEFGDRSNLYRGGGMMNPGEIFQRAISDSYSRAAFAMVGIMQRRNYYESEFGGSVFRWLSSQSIHSQFLLDLAYLKHRQRLESWIEKNKGALKSGLADGEARASLQAEIVEALKSRRR